MSFPILPNIDGGVGRFGAALNDAQLDEEPYRCSALADVLPEGTCVGVFTLPIAPLVFDDCNGVRDRHCEKRCFFTPRLQSHFPACALFAAAMQRPEIARAFGDVAASANCGALCALAVVVEKSAPVIFRAWRPGEPTGQGFRNIPVPE